MKLFYLLKNINCRVLGNQNIDILGLFHRDTEVKNGGMFFCLRGTNVDGNDYALSAIKNGAIAIVTDSEIKGVCGVTQVIVKNTREAMSYISARFFGNPSKKMKMIGVTGTNGKTTVSSMIYQILKFNGKRSALIGTNGIEFLGQKFETNMTTPDPIELNYYLSQMVKNKVEYVCMEISAHAIDLKKIEGIIFELIIFTNLSEDHLDYFKTIERYFAVKASIFNQKYTKFAIFNIDDEFGNMLNSRINMPKITYAINNHADYMAVDIKSTTNSQSFKLNGAVDVEIPILGRFNIANAVASISAIERLGFDKLFWKPALLKLHQIDGRFNQILVGGVLVIVDFAHTPDGLSSILSTAKDLANGNKLISVFGCGGNRETQKREIMGEISSKIADFSIITSDNPRFERREKIAEDIVRGITTQNYLVELDRSRAIEKALFMANKGDVVVIAGKGAEIFIEENGEKIPFNDMAYVEKLRRKIDG